MKDSYIIEKRQPLNEQFVWCDKKYSLQRKSCEHYIQNSLKSTRRKTLSKPEAPTERKSILPN
jgi:hypothetical protein